MSKHKISIFYCTNVFGDGAVLPAVSEETAELNFVAMPCSSMVRDVFLLRAFEAGADAVMVLMCQEGACRYLEGNLRAAKRVKRVQDLLDDIGLDGRRLAFFNIRAGNTGAVEEAVRECISTAAVLGSNPAAGPQRPRRENLQAS